MKPLRIAEKDASPAPTPGSTHRALLISSDPSLVLAVREAIASIDGIELHVVEALAASVEHCQRNPYAIRIVHISRWDSESGLLRCLGALASDQPPAPTLVISDGHHAERTLTLLKLGVNDCLSRPIDLGRLSYLINVLTLKARHEAAPSRAARPLAIVETDDDLGPTLRDASGRASRLMEQIRRVAPQDATVLLGGETGVGKTRIAGKIHDLSRRRDLPFLTINCASLSENLIESEMFGHVRGAFTGAENNRAGKFADVGAGTLFLDEIDSLPPALQAKLLRVVEARVFEPVGSNKSQPMEARLIVASNLRLDQEVKAGRFRADLYYRLNVVSFELPSLRDQVPAILPLAHVFLEEFAAKAGLEIHGFSADAIQGLEEYHWPGNIRELRNTVERAVLLSSDSIIRLDDFPHEVRRSLGVETAATTAQASTRAVVPAAIAARVAPTPAPSESLSRSKEDAERNRIAQALTQNKNNRQKAAAELGISRMTLYNKLHKYGLMTGA